MIGQTISHFTITEKLGEGGMGVVYKAQDTKLDRAVALKFLPIHLNATEQDKARFLQEAKAAAALNHPNICSVMEVQEHDGQMFIVMEFVEGQTLNEKSKSMSFKQALETGIQIADGLAAAHEKGVVHRDIKPENIMIRKDGIVQIMDFGLAKLHGVTRLTKEGSTVGTAGYMSPEQVQGHDVDNRSDIFSLGVVLYEMFTGVQPFRGVHETAMQYEIVNVDPAPMSSVKPELPEDLDAIVLECLAKDPDERYQSAKEVAKELRRLKRESSRQRVSRITAARPVIPPAQPGASAPQPSEEQWEPATAKGPLPRFLRTPWVPAAIVLGVGCVVLGYLYIRSNAVPAPVIRSFILPPAATAFENDLGGHQALSPDGKMLAFVATDSAGRSQLWVRALSSLSPVPLPGTDKAQYPFWSPESKSIAFFADGKMKRVDATGGPVTVICDAEDGRGGSWNPAGVIVFAPGPTTPIYRVEAAGGSASVITRLDSTAKESSHRWPFFLPDGRHFLYTTQTANSGVIGSIIASAIDDSSRKVILGVSSNMGFFNGYLVYVRQYNLIAHPFDPGMLQLAGDPIPIAERVVYSEDRSRGIFSLSRNGVLVYQSGNLRAPRLCLVDRNGKVLSTLKTPNVEVVASFSPDGKRLVLDNYDASSRNSDIWLYDIARGISTRFTFDPADDYVPVFSPDGKRVVFSSTRRKSPDLFVKSISGMTPEEFLYGSPLEDYASAWSPDGESLLLSVRGDPRTKWDLLLLPLTGDKKAIPLAQTEFNEWAGVFSPDGRWVAYQSDESGSYEIYVRTIDPHGGKWQVSSAGGEGPSWLLRSDEIIYTSRDQKVMSAVVKYSPASFEVVRTTALFDLNNKGSGKLFDVTSDGKEFLVQFTGIEGESSPVTLVTHWQEELKK